MGECCYTLVRMVSAKEVLFQIVILDHERSKAQQLIVLNSGLWV